MISGHNNRNSQYGTLNYYKPKNPNHHVRAHHFQMRNGQKEVETFRKKKTSDCQDLMYSSCLNPFARNKNIRFDQSYKDTFQRRRKVPQASYPPTDPVSLQYQPPQKYPQTRAPFQTSTILQVQSQKKNLLPAQRQYSPTKRRYHRQFGFSQSLEKFPRTRQIINSSNMMKPVLQYSSARHATQECTPKIGSRYYYL